MSGQPYVVGLTGGIASGKSLVASLFEELGATVIDADQMVAECYAEDTALKLRLLLSFGPGIFSWPFTVDRRKLGGMAFSDREKLSKLEEIVWPHVFERMERRIEASEGIVIVEGSRIFESGYDRHLREVIVVESSPETQRYRLMERRGLSQEDADRIIGLQRRDMAVWPAVEHVIRNGKDSPDGSYQDLREQVGAIWQSLRDKAQLG